MCSKLVVPIQPPCTEPGDHFWQRSFYRHLENRLNVDHGDSLSSGTPETGDVAPKKKKKPVVDLLYPSIPVDRL